MSFDEQPDGDIHGEDARVVDAYMKMTVHAAHCHAMLVAALEGLDLPSVDFWVCRHPAEIRALTSAVCTQAKRVNVIEQQLDTCRPYLKEGETVADALKRLSERKTVRSLCEAYEACKPFLKDGEAPAECLARNRADIDRLMGFLATEKTARDTLQEDAARYRWLRQKSTVISWIDAGIAGSTGITGSGFARLECDQLDAAIDKARAAHGVAG